jgi:hypothetical protein
LHALRHGLRPGKETGLKALRIEAGKDPATGVMGGHAMGQSEEGLKPGALKCSGGVMGTSLVDMVHADIYTDSM